jgi:hypothetical protein
MQLELYNPKEYWSRHKLIPQEYPIGTYNFTIYNFGPAARVAIACIDTLRDPHMQTFVVYPGRNLLCACRLRKECYITVTGVEEDTLMRMKNGNDSRLNLQLYQGGITKHTFPASRTYVSRIFMP